LIISSNYHNHLFNSLIKIPPFSLIDSANTNEFKANGTPINSDECVEVSTKFSLRSMIAPGILVIGSPLFVGYLFGPSALAGLLAGALVSGVQMAISMSNSGGAWDNCKKGLEAQGLKKTEAYRNAVIGDTVGDPLKDTSGPSLSVTDCKITILKDYPKN